MSTSVAFSSYGGPEVIVRVQSAGVQPFDVRVRRGDLRRWVPVSFPQVLGNEFAGVIEEVGQDAGAFEVGDGVIGFTNMRAYAEGIVSGVDGIVPKPPSMPWEEAGVLSAAGQTAHSESTSRTPILFAMLPWRTGRSKPATSVGK